MKSRKIKETLKVCNLFIRFINIVDVNPRVFCMFSFHGKFPLFMCVPELHFYLNASKVSQFFLLLPFLFDSLFIFLQFIEKVFRFLHEICGTKFSSFTELSIPRPVLVPPPPPPLRRMSGKLFLLSFNFEKIKRMFLPMPSLKNESLQVNVLIKGFCRFSHSSRSATLWKRVHKFRRKEKKLFSYFAPVENISNLLLLFSSRGSSRICEKNTSGTGIRRKICIEIQYLTIEISEGNQIEYCSLRIEQLILYVCGWEAGKIYERKLTYPDVGNLCCRFITIESHREEIE